MKMRMKWGAALFAVCLAASADAAGSLSVSTAPVGSGMVRYTIIWTADGSGDVSGNRLDIKRGEITQVQFVPSGGGTQPDDLYDVVLNETNGVDVFDGLGSNLPQGTTEIGRIVPGYLHDAIITLDLVVSNAGASNVGTISVWVKP